MDVLSPLFQSCLISFQAVRGTPLPWVCISPPSHPSTDGKDSLPRVLLHFSTTYLSAMESPHPFLSFGNVILILTGFSETLSYLRQSPTHNPDPPMPAPKCEQVCASLSGGLCGQYRCLKNSQHNKWGQTIQSGRNSSCPHYPVKQFVEMY